LLKGENGLEKESINSPFGKGGKGGFKKLKIFLKLAKK
jgi:hypothetical protein